MTSRDSLLLVGGPSSGKSTIGNLLLGRRLLPASPRSAGRFGVSVEVGDAPPVGSFLGTDRTLPEMGGRRGWLRPLPDTLYWIDRGGANPEGLGHQRLSELALDSPAVDRVTWPDAWLLRARAEVGRCACWILIVSPRGLPTADATLLRAFLAAFPSLRDIPAEAWVNVRADLSPATVEPLLRDVRRTLGFILRDVDVHPLFAKQPETHARTDWPPAWRAVVGPGRS